MRVNLDPATIGGKLSFCRMKSRIVDLTCVRVGVKLTATKLTAASKALSLKYVG